MEIRLDTEAAVAWQPEDLAGHAPYCAHPYHSLASYCAADPADPPTMHGEPSQAWHRDHPAPRYTLTVRYPQGGGAHEEHGLESLRETLATLARVADALSPGETVEIKRIS